MSDVEDRAGVLPERVREAPSGVEAPPPDNLRGKPTPEDVVALVDAHLLALAGTYGDPEAGDPIQYDELRMEHDQGDVEIVVYYRAILPFFTDSEAVKRIHQVCWRLENLAHLVSVSTSCRSAEPSGG